MKKISDILNETRGNIRPDEALLKRILTQIPEKEEKRRLLSPYVTYALASFASVYALFVISLPLYEKYEAYRVENDIELMMLDEDIEESEWGINELEEEMLMLE